MRKKKSTSKNHVAKETVKHCFVPSCTNIKVNNDRDDVGQRLQFFQVPDGIEGLFWEKAVKIRKRKYDKMIDLLSSTDYMLGLNDTDKNGSVPTSYQYCCEIHFDVETDIERIYNENGVLDFKVKAGVVPQIKPKQRKRLWDSDAVQGNSEDIPKVIHDGIKLEESMNDEIVIEENSQDVPTTSYVYLVDISTLTHDTSVVPKQAYYQGANAIIEEKFNSSFEPIMPMLPLTTALMKRKSPYYMGLQQNHFLQLLDLAQQNLLSDVKVMVTLRKLRLNEEFEALGDLFDLDKTTTERYFDEAKVTVIHLVDMLCNPAMDHNDFKSEALIKYKKYTITTTTATTGDHDPILLQPMNGTKNPIQRDEPHTDDEVSSESSEQSESSSLYSPSGPDSESDVMSDELTSVSDESVRHVEKTDECYLCNQLFTPKGLPYHIAKIHSVHLLPTNLNKTTCGLCLQNFSTNLLLRRHQDEAHKGNAYGCDLCSKQFRARRQMQNHILVKHAEVKTFLCELCGVGYPYESALTKHRKAKHWKIRKYECHFCDTKYSASGPLHDHIRAIHTFERPFKCTFEGCGKTFSRNKVYRNHSRVHATDKFDCNICSKQFSFKGNLAAHKKNVHGMIAGKIVS